MKTIQSEPVAPPQEVRCSSHSSTSVLVSWLAPPEDSLNGEITGYSITYFPLRDRGNGTANNSARVHVNSPLSEATTYLLQGLEKWTEYGITVSAVNKAGTGPPSLAVVIRTEEDGMLPQHLFVTFTPTPLRAFLTTTLTPVNLLTL